MKMKDESDILLYLSFSSFYFKNLTLPLITRLGEMEGVGTSLNRINKAKNPSTAHQNTLQLQLAWETMGQVLVCYLGFRF